MNSSAARISKLTGRWEWGSSNFGNNLHIALVYTVYLRTGADWSGGGEGGMALWKNAS